MPTGCSNAYKPEAQRPFQNAQLTVKFGSSLATVLHCRAVRVQLSQSPANGLPLGAPELLLCSSLPQHKTSPSWDRKGKTKKLKSLEAPLYQTDPTNTYEHIPILLVGYASYASSVRMPRCHTEGASVRSTASNLTELCIRTVALVIPQIAHQLKRQGQKENSRKTEGLDFDMLIAHAGFAFLVISFCRPVCSLLPQHSTCPSVLTAQL